MASKLKRLTERVNDIELNMSANQNPLGVKLERFGGSENENPKERLRKFDIYVAFHGWKDEKKYAAF